MRVHAEALVLIGVCMISGCGWSGVHRQVFSDCMQALKTQELHLVGPRGTLLPAGVTKSDYCWHLAGEQFRDLQQRGLPVEVSR